MLEWILYGLLGFIVMVAGTGSYHLWRLGLKKDALFFALITTYILGASIIYF